MANENNKTNELVFDRDDATSELEEVTLQHALAGTRSSQAEEDEDTFDIARIPGKGDGGVAGGEHDFRQAEVDRLQFDVEQLRSRLSGLQSELQAREEISADLNQRMAGLEEQLAARKASLEQRDRLINELKAEIRTRAAHTRELETTYEALLAGNERLERELAALREDRDRRAKAGEPQGRDIGKSRESGSPDTGAADALAQLARTEAYADEVRRRLSDKAEEAEWLEKNLQHSRMELHDKAALLEQLEAKLDGALADNQALADEIATMRHRHDEVASSLEGQLADAKGELERNALINEQLAADLEEGKAYRERMESMLNKSDDDFRNRIEDLEARLAEATEEKRKLEEQLANHNDAVNSLIKDLESHDDYLEPADLPPPGTAAPRDRVNRMLVGRIGDQELRFPLFKNRLTIGRTQQNDIQLNVPYISRRHAVVITEGNAARVIDWGSRNGVFVNSERITEHFLKSGDRITIGDANFRYEERPRRENCSPSPAGRSPQQSPDADLGLTSRYFGRAFASLQHQSARQVYTMAGSVAGKSTGTPTRSAIGRDLKKALFRKIWLPKLLYDAVPWFYCLAGTLALLAAVYTGGWLQVPPHALILPAGCLQLAVWVLLKRLRRRPGESWVDDNSRVRKDSAAW